MFSIGQKLTIFSISDFMAMTIKTECKISRIVGNRYAYKLPRKHKEYYLPNGHDVLIFDGWDLPIKRDADVQVKSGITQMRGNACFNLCADSIDVIKDYIENKNLNPNFTERDHILFIEGNKETLVYPNAPTDSKMIISKREEQKLEV